MSKECKMVCLFSDYDHPKVVKDHKFKIIKKEIKTLDPLHSLPSDYIDILSSISWHSEFLARLIIKWPEEVKKVLNGKTNHLFNSINNEINNINNINELELRQKIRTHRLKVSLLCALNEWFNLLNPGALAECNV